MIDRFMYLISIPGTNGRFLFYTAFPQSQVMGKNYSYQTTQVHVLLEICLGSLFQCNFSIPVVDYFI